ncbi:MAG TPA: (Fe-S)-binding protein, partial [Mycobacteriales bacterium]|nr:(Fe-S)-binding protein [Mycobacteriales bacterium]
MQTFAIVVSLGATVVAVALVARAAMFLVNVLSLGQPEAPSMRMDRPGKRLVTMLTETLGHTRMLRWSIPGLAHWFVFVGFGVLFSTLLEAYFELFDADFHLPLIGENDVYAMVIEVVTALTLLGILALIAIRIANRPGQAGRKSRFTGSNTWHAVFIELTIIGVCLSVFSIRGVRLAQGSAHYPDAAVISRGFGELFGNLSASSLETAFYLAVMFKILVSMQWFIVIAANPNMGLAWHRFTAFFNIFFKRHPKALGPLQPMAADFENFSEDDKLGVGKVEDFTWKQLLDTVTCTECGRCQSQCPAWNTGKPLSPKLLILNLRDHLIAKAPYLLAGDGATTPGADAVAEAARPLVGTYAEGGVIDPDVLWSCTTCGACVEQCPVDIEHVDAIIDMRRYQVLFESSFPSEAGVMLRNLESQGNPWGVSPRVRTEWTEGLGFEVRVFDDRVPDDVDWVFWVGCAGAIEDRSKKVTRAVAELLNTAGVSWGILGGQETCSGDPARRLGHEAVYLQLAQQNVETLNSKNVRRIVATCPHCFNTLSREYPQIGGSYEVVHHTQLLKTLIDEGRLVPITPVNEIVTYHDPCYLGRHNEVYTPPREVLDAIAGLSSQEMHRCKERGFCCGAGGARMWMEEKIGKQVNVERTEEALATGADIVSTACPFCMVMLSDAVTAKQQSGEAGQHVQVLDVAQILAKSLVR